ncbi:unnamed protein product [Amoebophrya sp. A25]|nr:unnamed protein product [Amoebophrya sp. A25]|eukprot:GSA25T00020646001.1
MKEGASRNSQGLVRQHKLHRLALQLTRSKNPTNLWDDCDQAYSLVRKFLNYAQDSMDQVFQRIFQILDDNKAKQENQKRFYVDVGVGPAGVEHYTRFFRTFQPHKWEGVMLDVGHSYAPIGYYPEMLSVEGVEAILSRHGVPPEIDLLVMQIDSFSWHVLRRLFLNSEPERRRRLRAEIRRRVEKVFQYGLTGVGTSSGSSCATRSRTRRRTGADADEGSSSTTTVPSGSSKTTIKTTSTKRTSNIPRTAKQQEQDFHYPKVIQIEHIHSYFWPDHMVPLGLNLVPAYKADGTAGELFRDSMERTGEDQATILKTKHRKEWLRDVLHEYVVEKKSKSSGMRGVEEVENQVQDTRVTTAPVEKSHDEPLSIAFTVANDYDTRVASQIRGYFKAYIATAEAVRVLANAFGYDVVYLGWWNMILVDRLETSRVEVAGLDEDEEQGESDEGVEDCLQNTARPGAEETVNEVVNQTDYASASLANVLGDDAAPGIGESGSLEDQAQQVAGVADSDDPLGDGDAEADAIIDAVTDELVDNLDDPLNTFDPQFVAARIQQKLDDSADPDGQGRTTSDDSAATGKTKRTSTNTSRINKNNLKQLKIRHLFQHKNDLKTLCHLYFRNTHRHYWQVPSTFFLHKNLCTTPENLIVGFSQEEINAKYWLDFLMNARIGSYGHDRGPSTRPLSEESVLAELLEKESAEGKIERTLSNLIRDPNVTF